VAGSQTSMLILESDDGRATAWTRQNAGSVLNAVKNSGEARRTLIGGTNLPASTSCAEVIVVFSRRRLRRAAQDCARAEIGANRNSANAHAER
jgi:hypothetical protein